MSHDATKVHGALKMLTFAAGIGNVVRVHDDEIELDSPLRTLHLPKGSPWLRLSGDGFEADVPDVGPVAFSAWRGSHWRSALATHGWKASAAATT
jgi:hypothetical protein